jgi:hypothetical protein
MNDTYYYGQGKVFLSVRTRNKQIRNLALDW